MQVQLRFAAVLTFALVVIVHAGWAPPIVGAVLVFVILMLVLNASVIRWTPGPRTSIVLRRALLGLFTVSTLVVLVSRPFNALVWIASGILLIGVWWRDLVALAGRE